MFAALLGSLETGLALWLHKDKTKYIDKLVKIKKEWREEIIKPRGERSNQRLDDLEFELCLLQQAWSAVASQSNSGDSS